MKRTHALTALSACLVASTAFGSTMKISVLNETGFGQAGAKVTLAPTNAPKSPSMLKKMLNVIGGVSNGPKTYTATTDAYGAAKLSGVTAGTYTIGFQAAGYPAYSASVTLDDATADYTYSDYLKQPPNPGTVNLNPKIISEKDIPVADLPKYEKKLKPGAWPVTAEICARNSASHEYGSDIGFGAHLFSPSEYLGTYLTCAPAADGKTLAPKFKTEFLAIAGRKTASYVNGSTSPSVQERVSQQLTKITHGTPGASAYSFNYVEGKSYTVYFKDQTSNFFFGFDPASCMAKDGKPETDPAKLAKHECDGGYSFGDEKTNAFPEDVVTKAKDSTGTEYTYVRYQVKEVWLIAELDDGTTAGAPAKDGSQSVQKLELWLSGKSGTPMIRTNHFSTLVPADLMAEAMAVQQILDKDPTAAQDLGTALVKAYDSVEQSGAGQDQASQAPYQSGSYFRMGAKLNTATTALGVDQSESDFTADAQGNLVAVTNDGGTWQSEVGLSLGYYMGSPTNNPLSWQEAILPTPAGYQLVKQLTNGSAHPQTIIQLGSGGPTGQFPAALAELKANAASLAPHTLSASDVTSIQSTVEQAIEQASSD